MDIRERQRHLHGDNMQLRFEFRQGEKRPVGRPPMELPPSLTLQRHLAGM